VSKGNPLIMSLFRQERQTVAAGNDRQNRSGR